jgi:hypothetical protein
MNSEPHFLFSFLQQTLPTLGLDDEIYGPYLLGIFPQADESQSVAEIDEEELNNVLDLLQGSSQTHASDGEAFTALRAELLERNENYWCEYRIKMEQLKKDAMQQLEEERKRQETEASEQVVKENKKDRRNDPEEDLVKLRVVQQYAYDDSITYDANGDPIDTTNAIKGRGDEVLDSTGKGNRFNSSSNNVGKDQQPIPKTGSEKSKKAAREETARQKMMKIQAKEERRKRAVKGERRR